MTFIIPQSGVMLHVGKRLLKLKSGEYDTTDRVEIESLKAAKDVIEKKAKSNKAPN